MTRPVSLIRALGHLGRHLGRRSASGDPAPVNPYVVGRPVRDDRLLFGREPLVRRVLDTVHGNSVVLCGESRIGTSSALLHLARRLQVVDDPEYRFVPVLVDLETTPEEHFFAALTNAVQAQAGRASDPPAAADSPLGFHRLQTELRAVLHSLAAAGPRRVRLVLLLDGVDRLNRYDPRVNARLRSLFMKSIAEQLVCVAAGRSIERGWDRAASPWYNFFEEIEVGPIDPEAAAALVTRPVAGTVTYASSVVAAVVDHCQGRPEAIQRLCRALVDRAIADRRCKVERADLDAVMAELR